MLKSVAIKDQTTLLNSKPKCTWIADADVATTKSKVKVHFANGYSENSIDKYPDRKIAILNFANARYEIPKQRQDTRRTITQEISRIIPVT